MINAENNAGKYRFLVLPALFVGVIWVLFGLNYLFDLNFWRLAVEPRTTNGLLGIAFFPLLHSDLDHIVANTGSLFVLLVAVRYIFPHLFLKVFGAAYLWPGVFAWLIGRPAFHLGASGMIYALATFLFLSGVIRVNRYLLAISLLVVFLYGSLFWGIFPLEQRISWEGHLGGALTGFFLALWFRKIEPIEEVREREPQWEEDEDEAHEDAFWEDEALTDQPKEKQEITITYHYKPKEDDSK
jgi:membrane associated rhomboid family serine protease